MREISGTFFTLDGAPVVDEPVLISLGHGFYNADGVYLPSTLRATTDSEGKLTVSLAEGFAYSVQARSEAFSFALPVGAEPLTWSVVRALGVSEAEPSYSALAEYLERRLDGLGVGAPLEAYKAYPAGVNAAIRALIDRKVEQSDLKLSSENGSSVLDAGLL